MDVVRLKLQVYRVTRLQTDILGLFRDVHFQNQQHLILLEKKHKGISYLTD